MHESASEAVVSTSSRHPIGLVTLGSFLVGSRDAILRLSGNRSTLWVGLFFVLSAGFAREYDGEDLLAEPWHLLIPLVASVGSSMLLFLLVAIAARLHRLGLATVGRSYLEFLGLYWMTAPLAWLYAIPVERLLSAPDSVRANLWLLGLAAVWRVLLIIRVICVVYNAPVVSAAVLVLAFADVLVFVLMQTVDVPLLQIMGGVRLTESEQLIASVATNLIFLSVLTAPAWLIGASFVLYRGSQDWNAAIPPRPISGAVSRGLKTLIVASLAVWIVVLPITQPEQQLRTKVERLVQRNQLTEAIQEMQTAGPGEFPPHWTPPPQVSRRGIDIALVVKFLEHLEQDQSTDWLREIYWRKLQDAFHSSFSFESYWRWASSVEDRLALVELLERQPPPRVQALFGDDRPYPSSAYDEDNQSALDEELIDRFNALFGGDNSVEDEAPTQVTEDDLPE